MNITSETEYANAEDVLASDKTGLAEIEEALKQIEELQNSEEEVRPEVSEENEQPTEEDVETEVEPEEELTKKEKKEQDIWKIKKDKYRALAAKEALMKENEQLKQMLNESLNSGTYHYGKSAYSELEKAKTLKKKAIEDGDIDALIESDIALSKALNTVNDLEKWTYNEEQKKSITPEKSEAPTQNLNAIEQEIAADWLENHSYLQPDSPDYNPKFAKQVGTFIDQLDANLESNDQMDAYFSEAYFNTIENYILKAQNDSQKSAKKVESAAHIGGVRNSYVGSVNGKSGSPTQMILSADERRMCANAGITEKEWLKYKLEDLKKGK